MTSACKVDAAAVTVADDAAAGTVAGLPAVTGLVLAAGAGRRMGAGKAELVVGGRRLIDSAVAVLANGGCNEVLAVVRDAGLVVPGARCVVNSHADRGGMSSSLRVGLGHASGDWVAVLLVDQVGVLAGDVATMIAHIDGSEAVDRLVVARRNGKRSHPVFIPRRLFGAVSATAVGDHGARDLIDARPDTVQFVNLPGLVVDLDTPAELMAARQATDREI